MKSRGVVFAIIEIVAVIDKTAHGKVQHLVNIVKKLFIHFTLNLGSISMEYSDYLESRHLHYFELKTNPQYLKRSTTKNILC